MPTTASTKTRTISIAHSPDSDDAFMFYGLATNKVRVPGLKFTHTLCDIETLNRKAMEGVYDVTAISFHAYPYIQEKYALMSCGGSVGDGYGPMIVATKALSIAEIKNAAHRRAGNDDHRVPGVEAVRAARSRPRWLPFDQIIPQVLAGKHEAGLIIHEGQLDLRQVGAAPHPRSRQVVARPARPAAAAGRQRHPPRPGPGNDRQRLRRAAAQHPVRARPPRAGAELCHAVRARPGCRSRRTSSSACT